MEESRIRAPTHAEFAALCDQPSTGVKDLACYSVANFDFAERELDCAQLQNSHFPTSRFDGCSLYAASLSGLKAPDATWRRTVLRKSDIYESDLRRGNFEGANLSRCTIMESCFVEASFARADLSYASFRDCDLTGASFESACLEGTIFRHCHLDGVVWGASGAESPALIEP